jgi:hypothetical protein
MAPGSRRRVLERRPTIVADARSFGIVCLIFGQVGADPAQGIQPERQSHPRRTANSRSFAHT